MAYHSTQPSQVIQRLGFLSAIFDSEGQLALHRTISFLARNLDESQIRERRQGLGLNKVQADGFLPLS